MHRLFIFVIGFCGAFYPSTGRATLPSLVGLAPSAWTGVTRTQITPPVIGLSNAWDAVGFGYSPSGSQAFLAGALLLRTSDLLPYVHNIKTCRLVSDGALFTGATTLMADNAYFPAYTTQAANGNEVATDFVVWTLQNGNIIIDSRHLADDYPPVAGAVDSVTVQLWAFNLAYLNTMLRASLALWTAGGNVTFNNVSPPRMPLVMIQRASHFPNALTLQVMNYSDQSQAATIIVERYLTATGTPDVVVQPMNIVPGPSTVQLSINSFVGAITYVQDSTGARDQAYLGRAFQFFTDQVTGGTSSVAFDSAPCASGQTNTPGTLSLIPACASLSGTVQQYTGIYLPVGSYVGEVVSLESLGVTGIEFWAKSATPFRVQLEDIHVHDSDFHGVNLPATAQWTKFQIPFTGLTQRGFGVPVPFTGQILQISWLVPTVVVAPNAKPVAFSMAADAVAVNGPVTTPTPPPGLPQTISFGGLSARTLGTAPFALVASDTSGLPVTFVGTTTAICTVTGATVSLIAQGTCAVTASQAGNATYAAAPSVTQQFAVVGQSQTIKFAHQLLGVALGTPPFALSAKASSGLPVTYVSATTAVCTISGGLVTLIAAGTCSVTATQPGNSTYAAAVAVTQSFTVTQAATVALKAQTITFGPMSGRVMGTAPFALAASATSGLPVTFTSGATAVCTVSGTTATLVALGSCTVIASQAGNATYAPAASVTQTFIVAGESQTIKFTHQLLGVALGTAPFALSATASSGLPIMYVSATTAVCTVSGGLVTLIAAGTCSVTATQPGNSTYAAAAPMAETFTVTGKTQTITFGALSGASLGTLPFALNATTTSGLAVTYVSTTTAICTVSGSSVTLAAAGTCSITANQVGNAVYAPAAPVTQTFAVSAPVVKNPAIHASVQGGQVSGTVTGVTPPQSFRVALWAQTNEFYIQPCVTAPLAAIASNGTWGPISSHNGAIFAMLVSADYSPPSTATSLPAVDGLKVLAVGGPVGTVNSSNVVACPAQ